MIEAYLLWWPILWTGRIALLIVLVSVTISLVLYFARFLRLAHIRSMWNAPYRT